MAEAGRGSALVAGLPLWADIVLSAAIVCLSAYFAGTTLGVISLDKISLQIVSQASDDEKERKHASRFLSPLTTRDDFTSKHKNHRQEKKSLCLVICTVSS